MSLPRNPLSRKGSSQALISRSQPQLSDGNRLTDDQLYHPPAPPSPEPEEKMYDKPPFPEAQNMNQIYNLLKLLIKNQEYDKELLCQVQIMYYSDNSWWKNISGRSKELEKQLQIIKIFQDFLT